MSRAAVNFCVDASLAGCLIVVLAVSAVAHVIFPPGTAAAGWTLWGMGYDTWCDIQVAVLCCFSVVILIHLILHWTWVCGFVTARLSRLAGYRVSIDESSKTLYGVGSLIVVFTVIGSFLLAAEFAVRAPDSVATRPGPAATLMLERSP